MRALVAHAAADLRIEDRALDRSVGSVVVRPTLGGICGSDLHYYRHGRVGAFALREPLILGHEVIGEVVEDPSGSWVPGTRVAVHPAAACGHCPECRHGTPNVCRNGRYLGSAATLPHTQGAFAELAAFRPDQLRRIPDTLPDARAVLAEPLAVGIHAIARAGGVEGARVLVSGAGPIGLLAAAAAVRSGARTVTVADLLDRPLEVATRIGAHETIDLRTASPEESAYDVVLEAAGVPVAVSTAVRAVARRGVVVQIGMLPPDPAPIALTALIAKEAELRGAFRFDTEIDDALRLLDSDDAFDAIVTHRFPMSDALHAFDVAADPSVSTKVVLELQS